LSDPTNHDPKFGRTGDRPHWIRSASVFVRAAHLLGASVLAGAWLLEVEDPRLHAWWGVAAGTGALLLAAEYARHRELHREVCGWATYGKLILILLIPLAPDLGPWLMSAAFVVAVLGAHAPKRWRHRRIY